MKLIVRGSRVDWNTVKLCPPVLAMLFVNVGPAANKLKRKTGKTKRKQMLIALQPSRRECILYNHRSETLQICHAWISQTYVQLFEATKKSKATKSWQ